MKIVHYPHPSLRRLCRPLTSLDNKVRTQAQEMLALMYEHNGLGLAGPQVVLPYQMFVMNDTGDPLQKDHEHVLINPVIVERKGTMEGDEGCLSFPKLFQKVRRAKTIKVQYYDLDGVLREMEASELPSRVVQHETDHLHGVLFIDKMGPIAKLASRGSLREFEREYRRAQEKGEIPPDAEIERLLAALEAGL